MQKNPYMIEGLAIGIILLFDGVTIASSINQNVVKASQDDDLVEVTFLSTLFEKVGLVYIFYRRTVL